MTLPSRRVYFLMATGAAQPAQPSAARAASSARRLGGIGLRRATAHESVNGAAFGTMVDHCHGWSFTGVLPSSGTRHRSAAWGAPTDCVNFFKQPKTSLGGLVHKRRLPKTWEGLRKFGNLERSRVTRRRSTIKITCTAGVGAWADTTRGVGF